MTTNKPTVHSDALGDFLSVRGLTTEWLLTQCAELQEDAEAASAVLAILADLVESGIALPPVAADMVSAALRCLAAGKDARVLVGTAPTRGRPVSSHARNRRDQAGACLALMKLAGIDRSSSVKLLATTMPMAEREVEDILVPEMLAERDIKDKPVPEMTSKWNHKEFLMEAGGQTLKKLLQVHPDDGRDLQRAKLLDFCSVTQTG